VAFRIVSFREEQSKAALQLFMVLTVQNQELTHFAIYCKHRFPAEVAGTFREKTGTPPDIIATGDAPFPTNR
jgi:hypothetical protein